MPDFLPIAASICIEPYAARTNVETLAARRLYAHRGAELAVILTRDRAGKRHVATEFDYRLVGRTYEASDGWQTRTYAVCWDTFGGDEAA